MNDLRLYRDFPFPPRHGSTEHSESHPPRLGQRHLVDFGKDRPNLIDGANEGIILALLTAVAM
jgi:hypothetical protein